MHTARLRLDYKVVAPADRDAATLLERRTLPSFDPSVLAFIDALSEAILHGGAFKQYPELLSMAYWMRKAGIARLKKDFELTRVGRTWVGRGLVFHIAPSNVDSIFIYSWFLSMLAGNKNIVRISGRTGRQIELLIDLIAEKSADRRYSEVADRFLIVRYEHNEEITGYFSTLCDMRVIWGGDETIRAIRRIPLKPSASELTFADRFSLYLIKAAAFVGETGKDRIIDNFYNDAYWFDQMACSSPRLVVWSGDAKEIEGARNIFWQLLEKKVVQKKPGIQAAAAVDKLVSEYSLAIQNPGVVIEKTGASVISRVLLASQKDIRRDIHCGGGLFYELKIGSLDELSDVVTSKEQTVGVIGFNRDEIQDFLSMGRPEGIARFVAPGKALQFSSVWDGYDLLREFSREIEIDL